MPTRRIVVLLKRDALPGDYPTVDPATGELTLLRFPGLGGGYEASLAHELVHAIRRDLWTDPKQQTDAFLFWEEGLAEILAVEAGFPSAGFPNYGFPISIAAGARLRAGQLLPLPELVRKHKALNFRCMAQAYVLRLSLMTYLRERFGLMALVRLGYPDGPLQAQDIERVLGAPLETLAGAWQEWAERRFASEKDSAKRAEVYLSQTPIRYLPVCPAGR